MYNYDETIFIAVMFNNANCIKSLSYRIRPVDIDYVVPGLLQDREQSSFWLKQHGIWFPDTAVCSDSEKMQFVNRGLLTMEPCGDSSLHSVFTNHSSQEQSRYFSSRFRILKVRPLVIGLTV